MTSHDVGGEGTRRTDAETRGHGDAVIGHQGPACDRPSAVSPGTFTPGCPEPRSGRVIDSGEIPHCVGDDRRTAASADHRPRATGHCCFNTPLSWLPGVSTLQELKAAAIAAGFLAQQGSKPGNNWRFMTAVKPPLGRPVRLGDLIDPQDNMEQVWDARCVDYGLAELWRLTGVSPTECEFRPFARIAHKAYFLPEFTPADVLGIQENLRDLMTKAHLAGYTHVWRMRYPGDARFRWLPAMTGCLAMVKAAGLSEWVELAASLGVEAIRCQADFEITAEAVRPGVIACRLLDEDYEPQRPIYLAHIEAVRSGYRPVDD